MIELDPIYESLRADAHISSNKSLRFSIGINEADLFAELLSRRNYFALRDDLTPDGYFFNTVCDLYAGTAITPKAQRLAIANLQKVGLIDVELRGIPAKRFFRIINDPELMGELLRKGQEMAKTAKLSNDITSYDQRSHLDVTKGHTNKTNIIKNAPDNRKWLNVVDKKDDLKIIQTEVYQ